MSNPFIPLESPTLLQPARPLLIVTEGVFDIACLKQLSRIVHDQHSHLPDLPQLSDQGHVVFLPAGGGDLSSWAHRLLPLGLPEYHLYDREQTPETGIRQALVETINQRPGCRAVLTSRRALENYLHPTAIEKEFGCEIEITPDTHVPEAVARATTDWPQLSPRARQRVMNRIKRRLNTRAVQHMTPALLADSDPAGEIMGWFEDINILLPTRKETRR